MKGIDMVIVVLAGAALFHVLAWVFIGALILML
jgi:hypothetical protein